VRKKFLFDADATSLDACNDRQRSNCQLGIFIKKISRIKCYVTSSSPGGLNSSKANCAQKFFSKRVSIAVGNDHSRHESISLKHSEQSLERFKTIN
jgi:hypothetical protein